MFTVTRIHQRIQRPAYQKRTLHGVRRFTGKKEFMDIPAEIAEMGMGIVRQEHLHPPDKARYAAGVAEPFRVPVQHQGRRPQPIGVFQQKDRRAEAVGFHFPRGFRLDMFTGSVGERAGPPPLVPRPPHGISFEALHRHDSRLAATPAFHHTLQQFKRVEPIGVQARIPDRQRFLQRRIQPVFEIRVSPGQRHRGTGQKRYRQHLRPVVHPL